MFADAGVEVSVDFTNANALANVQENLLITQGSQARGDKILDPNKL